MLKILLTLVTTYTLLGFVVIPYLTQSYMPTILKKFVASDGFIGRVFLNPFSFELELHDFLLKDKEGKTLVFFKTLSLDVDPSEILDKKIVIKNLYIQNLSLNILKDSNATLNFEYILQHLAKGVKTQDENLTQQSPSSPFVVVLKNFTLLKALVAFEDHSKQTPFLVRTKPINITLRDIQTKPHHINKINLEIATNTLGKIILHSDVILEPLSVKGDFKLQELGVNKIFNYVKTPEMDFTIESSPLSFGLLYSFEQKGAKQFVALEDINLDFSKLTFTKDANTITTSNFHNTIQTLETTLQKETTYTISKVNTTIQKIDVNNSLNLTKINLEVDKLSSFPNATTKLSFKSVVNSYASIQSEAKLFVAEPYKQTTFSTKLRNLDLPSLSLYSARYLGSETAKGKLDISLDYEIQNSQLESKNNIVIHTLELGKSVESKDAIDAPLSLAIGLLKDGDDNIVLDVPIEGDINDPSFHIGDVISTTMTNMVVNVATSPFKFLGSLSGLDGDEISSISFEEGNSTIVLSQKEKLDNLVKLFKQKDKLILHIQPTYDKTKDTLTQDKKLSKDKVKLALEKLAKQRVSVVKDYLILKKLNPSRIKVDDEVITDSTTLEFKVDIK